MTKYKNIINKPAFYFIYALVSIVLIGVFYYLNTSLQVEALNDIPLVNRSGERLSSGPLISFIWVSLTVFLGLFGLWLYKDRLTKKEGWSSLRFILVISLATFLFLQGALLMNLTSINKDYGLTDKEIKTTTECNSGPCLIDSFDYNNISSENDILSENILFTYDQLQIWKDVSSDPGLYSQDPIAVETDQSNGYPLNSSEYKTLTLKITCSQDAIKSIDWYRAPEKKVIGGIVLDYNPLIQEVKRKCKWESEGMYSNKADAYSPK